MATTSTASARPQTEPADEFLWLEEIHGEQPMEWVREQNRHTDTLLDGPDLEYMTERVLDVMDSPSRIPAVTKHGPYYYNFWRDAQHPRGLWRRTTLDSYRTEEPEWDVILDVDGAPRGSPGSVTTPSGTSCWILTTWLEPKAWSGCSPARTCCSRSTRTDSGGALWSGCPPMAGMPCAHANSIWKPGSS